MRQLVVLGSGIAAYRATSVLQGRLEGRRHVGLTVVSSSNHFLYRPLLHHVISGGLETTSISVPYTNALRDSTRLVVASELQVDAANNRVVADQNEIDYDYLVVALDREVDWGGSDTCRRHAHRFHTAGDGADLRSRLQRSDSRSYLVVGSGPAGVELASELRHVLGPLDGDDSGKVICIDQNETPLTDLPRQVRDSCREHFEATGIEFRGGRRVVECDEKGVRFADGNRLDAEQIVWCAGTRPPSLLEDSDLPTDARGHLEVDGRLSVPGHSHVYAAGASVAGPSGADSRPDANASQGETAAKNVLAELSGRTPTPWQLDLDRWLVSLGPDNAVVYRDGLVAEGTPGWALYRMLHASFIPGIARKLGLVGAWVRDGVQRTGS